MKGPVALVLSVLAATSSLTCQRDGQEGPSPASRFGTLAVARLALLGDSDDDGVADFDDDCPWLANADQADADGDFVGDACDPCPLFFWPDMMDSDGDGLGDACDPWTPHLFGNPVRSDVGTGGVWPAGDAGESTAVSGDGRFVAFSSTAGNLVDGDTNEVADVFVHDRQTLRTTRISVASDGSEGLADSGFLIAISGDGRTVLFDSLADLAPGGDPWSPNIYLHDRDPDGDGVFDEPGEIATHFINATWAWRLSLSGDGRHLISGDQLYDRDTDNDGVFDEPGAAGPVGDPLDDAFVSESGRFVVYSVAGDVTVLDRDPDADGLFDEVGGTTTSALGVSGWNPVISADGRHVAFAGFEQDVRLYVHDRDTDGNGLFDEAGGVATVPLSEAWDDDPRPTMSRDGRFVTFQSKATDLVPDDTNDARDVFVHDRDTDEDGVFDEPGATATLRANIPAGGTQFSYGDAYVPVMSADGRFVQFLTAPGLLRELWWSGSAQWLLVTTSNPLLAPDDFDLDGVPDAIDDCPFLPDPGQVDSDGDGLGDVCDACPAPLPNDWDRDGACGDVDADEVPPWADNCPGAPNPGQQDDDADGTGNACEVEPADVDAAGDPGNGQGWGPAIDTAGDTIVFWSDATDLVPGDTNGATDVFVWSGGAVERVSVRGGVEQDRNDWWGPWDTTGWDRCPPAVDGSGRFVAFDSDATNLDPDPDPADAGAPVYSDVFLYDRDSDAIVLISEAPDGRQGNGHSACPAVSRDGRYVAWWSRASNLVPGDTNGVADVFVRDRQTGVTVRVSVAGDGTQANGGTPDPEPPGISDSGRFVAFSSFASNLVVGDTNGSGDVFVRDRDSDDDGVFDEAGAVATTRGSLAFDGQERASNSRFPNVSGDGRFVVFLSEHLFPDTAYSCADVYVYDGIAGTLVVASVSLGGGGWGDCPIGQPSITADGRYVAFESFQSGLARGDLNWEQDVFVRDLVEGRTLRVSLVPGDGVNDYRRWGRRSGVLSTDGRFVALVADTPALSGDDLNHVYRIPNPFQGGSGPVDGDGDGSPADVDCDDGDPDVFPGNVEVCDGKDNDCDSVPDNGGDALCDDGDACTGAETCGGAAGCQAGVALVCDDGTVCTVDGCDPGSGACSFLPAPGMTCDDLAGTGLQTVVLDADLGRVTVTFENVTAPGRLVMEARGPGECDPATQDGFVLGRWGLDVECYDFHLEQGLAFTGKVWLEFDYPDTAPDDGVVDGTPINECTQLLVLHNPDGPAGWTQANGRSDNSLGPFRLPGTGVCGTGVECKAPAIPCTRDTVIAEVTSFSEFALGTVADDDADGVPDLYDACAGTPGGELVDYDGCACTDLGIVMDCSWADDGDACTEDGCLPYWGGICGSLPIDCEDGDLCTLDTCDPATGQCANTAVVCGDDGDACTIETCDPATGGCVAAPASVDDGVACTVDACDPLVGVTHVPDDALCDDSDACTLDSCDPTLGCTSAPNPNATCTAVSAGANVTLDVVPSGGLGLVSVTFESVTAPGSLVLDSRGPGECEPATQDGFVLGKFGVDVECYDFHLAGGLAFTGKVWLTFDYPDAAPDDGVVDGTTINECTQLLVLHNPDGPAGWTQVNGRSDGTLGQYRLPGSGVCGTGTQCKAPALSCTRDTVVAEVTSFSPFALGRVLDTDRDGVPEPLDACPGTPAGEPVDETGCSCVDRGIVCDDGDGCPDRCDPVLGCVFAECGCGSLEVTATLHTVGAGARPPVHRTPLAGITVGVYDTAPGSCAAAVGTNPASYQEILDTCASVAAGVTGAEGVVRIPLVAGDYVVVSGDATKTVLPYPLGVSAGGFSCAPGGAAGVVTMQKHLQQIERSDGSKVPGKTTRREGSVLYIVEPEFIEWDGTEEPYPFVLLTEGDWTVTTTVTPPEGFVADHESLTEEVNTAYRAVQFTLTDVGSDWVPTWVSHRVRHKGRVEVIRSAIGVRMAPGLARAKGIRLDRRGQPRGQVDHRPGR